MRELLITALLIITVNTFSQPIEWTESTDGTKIAFTKSGSGQLTLIFVHGWCCNKDFWKYQIPHFSQKYTTVVMDLAGYGQSDTRENHSFNNWGDDILSVVEATKPEKYILIGHSSGGYVVLNAGTKADNRLLAIIGADAYRGKLEKTYSEEYAKKVEEANRLSDKKFKESMRDIDRWFVTQSDSLTIEWVKDQMVECKMETAAQGVREYYLYRNNTAEEFDKIKCNVYGINKSSSHFDMDFFQNNHIDFIPYYMEDVGHFIMMDDPGTFNNILEEIIKLSKQQ
jgi:pimeloyl-ACP methyl ester carboxylesterase